MATTFTLGLWAVLADPTQEEPGGFCRDELLFHVRDFGGKDLPSYYELREVLSADLPMASGSESDRGELVVMAGDGTGGPLRPDVAEHLLRLWDATPQRGTVRASPDKFDLTPRAIIVPDGFPDRDVPPGKHPFAGMRIASVSLVRDAVRAFARADEGDDVIAMLTLCAVHGFVVAAVEA